MHIIIIIYQLIIFIITKCVYRWVCFQESLSQKLYWARGHSKPQFFNLWLATLSEVCSKSLLSDKIHRNLNSVWFCGQVLKYHKTHRTDSTMETECRLQNSFLAYRSCPEWQPAPVAQKWMYWWVGRWDQSTGLCDGSVSWGWLSASWWSSCAPLTLSCSSSCGSWCAWLLPCLSSWGWLDSLSAGLSCSLPCSLGLLFFRALCKSESKLADALLFS